MAQLKFLRASPRKVKLVIDLIRGERVARALAQLANVPQGSARPVAKLLASAFANAKQKTANLTTQDMWVTRVEVGQGPRLKRVTPRAMGRATPIQRPTAHLRLVVSDVAPKRSRKPR